MFDVKIYGEIVPFQDSSIISNGYTNLSELERQLKEAGGQDIRVLINSFGGDVESGFSMYSALRRYAKENNANITTLVVDRCASIATVPLMAGDVRIVNEYTSPFIHNAWTYEQGDGAQMMKTAVNLIKVNQRLAQFYADHTDLTVDEALILMEAETSITAEDCVTLRFATQVEYAMRPMALKRILNSKSNFNKMAKTKTGFLNKLMRELGFSSQNKILFDANNDEVDFFELEDDQAPKIGDKANYKGAPADGSIVMTDGQTFAFEGGELMEMKDGESAEEVPAETVEEINELITELKEEIAEVKEEIEDVKEEVAETMAMIVNSFKALKAENDGFKAKLKSTSKGVSDLKDPNTKVKAIDDSAVTVNFKNNRKKK